MDFITVMEWIGTVAFAISGALVAIRKKYDYYGICFLAIITAIGGGIIRDMLVGRHLPASLDNPWYAAVSIITAALVIIFYKRIDKIKHLVALADAFGLAAFTAIGSKVAVDFSDGGVYVIIAMAVLTGTFGGVLRDVFAHETPQCFRREVYAAASIAGAVAYASTYENSGELAAMYICFGVTLAIRVYAVFRKLDLPRVRLEEDD